MKTITRNCNNCQELYEAEQRYLNRGQGMFCSQRCSSLYHGRKRAVNHEPNTMCAWCGIDFYRTPGHKNSKSGLYFCSVEHQNLGATNGKLYRTGPVGIKPNRRPYRKLKTLETCCVCHEDFETAQRDTFIHQSCSRLLDLAHKINQWLSGDNAVTLYRTKDGNPKDTHKFVKQHLLDTRGDKCERCGFSEHGPFGSIIQMDHVNGNCFDNRLENLKLLCPNCHAMTPTYGSRNRGSGRAHRRK